MRKVTTLLMLSIVFGLFILVGCSQEMKWDHSTEYLFEWERADEPLAYSESYYNLKLKEEYADYTGVITLPYRQGRSYNLAVYMSLHNDSGNAVECIQIPDGYQKIFVSNPDGTIRQIKIFKTDLGTSYWGRSLNSLFSSDFIILGRVESFAIENEDKKLEGQGYYIVGDCLYYTHPAVYNNNFYGGYQYSFFVKAPCTVKGSYTVPEYVEAYTNTAFEDPAVPVVGIGAAAFFGCSEITNIAIPDSVTYIGDYAFAGCTGLTSITIPESVTSIGSHAFDGCTGLTSITIPESVTDIGDHAFAGCTNLKSVTIYGAIESIGIQVFSGCTGLTSIVIPESVTTIDGAAFLNCSELKSISIPDLVTKIGNAAFMGCSGLTSISLPDAIETIGNSAFSGCSGLSSITIPASIRDIGSDAFSGCSCSIVFADDHTYIPSQALRGASEITSVTIPDSVTIIGAEAFMGCSALTTISLPDSIKTIGNSAFSGCSGLSSITIPASIQNIGSDAFSGCSCSIVFADGLTSIPSQALCRAEGITSVSIPDSVASICSSAFSYCSSLTSIAFSGTKAQWDNIDKYYRWRDGVPAESIHCSDGDVSLTN